MQSLLADRPRAVPTLHRLAARARVWRAVPVAAALTLAAVITARAASADCSNGPGGGTPLGNVVWGLVDSVAACPAGDSVLAGRPSRLRIWVAYSDVNCNPKVGVPPESIWVYVHSTTSNLKVNDEGAKIFADDSTDASGYARVTIPSFPGNGTIAVGVGVSGASQGLKTATVRTTDSNADGRSDGADATGYSDINYSGGAPDLNDLSIIVQHSNPKHWHRNVLYGSLVRLTNACPTCGAADVGELGDGDVSWSPNGNMVALSIHDVNDDCNVALLPSDPAAGTIPRFLSFPPAGIHDYAPVWSPLGNSVFWSRADNTLQWKGVPGRSADTTTYTIPVTPSLSYMTDIDLSPDGQTIAFAGLPATGTFHIYTVPVSGGAPTQVTSSSMDDDYPKWAPDGSVILFWRYGGGQSLLYEVSSSGGTPVRVTGGSSNALPSYHPDGAVLVYSLLNGSGHPQIATLDSSVANVAGPVVNYPDFLDNNLAVHHARISPDGTRLMMESPPPGTPSQNPQLWITRRNMSAPPVITSFGGQQIADSTATIPVSVVEGLNFSATLDATDPEGDALACEGLFLQLGMTFDPATRVFSWTPPSQSVGLTYNVKFLVDTPSGGTDSFIAQFTVHAPAGPAHSIPIAPGGIRLASPVPVRDRLEFAGDFRQGGASLDVYDAGGRCVVRLYQDGGQDISWDLKAQDGERVRPGVFFYHARGGGHDVMGKVVILR